MGSHKCAAKGCYVMIDRRKLMCLKHWRKVGNTTQRNVYRSQAAWRNGQVSAQVYTNAVEQAKVEAAR